MNRDMQELLDAAMAENYRLQTEVTQLRTKLAEQQDVAQVFESRYNEANQRSFQEQLDKQRYKRMYEALANPAGSETGPKAVTEQVKLPDGTKG